MEMDRYRDARPHLVRAVAAFAVAVAGFVCGAAFGQFKKAPDDPATSAEKLIAVAGALVVLAAGAATVRALASALRKGLEDEPRRAASLAFMMSVVGYLFVLLAALGSLDQPVEKILLGGALTGVILGIAAQQTLGNFFAGIVLLVVKPFAVGERVVLKSGPLGGEYEGVVTEMTTFYVHLLTELGPVQLPNAGVLAAAIGPGARSPKDEEPPEEQDPGTQHGGTAAG